MAKDKALHRRAIIKKLERDMKKDTANPQKVSKWLKVVETKKRLFVLEDQIDKLLKQLKDKS